VENGEIQLSQGVQSDDGVLEQSPVASVLAPLVVMIVDRLPGNLFSVRTKLIPLHSSSQNIQDVVENLVIRDLRLSTPGLCEAGLDESVELVLTHFSRQFVVAI